ncbi:hypothetical protein GY45DRAFT_1321301 [Cubamyces sp. BRFM 1775]|nr:hypothetical protein GY45DRAFT_1321301 [Cubamyces sp. BRFM 1775]
MHAFAFVPVLASIAVSHAHSKMLHSRQPCSSDCSSSSGSSGILPVQAWLASCLTSAGCPNPKDVCSDIANVKACVYNNTNSLGQATPVSYLASLLQHCPDKNDNVVRGLGAGGAGNVLGTVLDGAASVPASLD